MPPVKSGETIASAPALRSFGILRTSWQRATTRTFGFSCFAVSAIIRLRLSSPVTANTPSASSMSAASSWSSSLASPASHSSSGKCSACEVSCASWVSITTNCRCVRRSSVATLRPTRPKPAIDNNPVKMRSAGVSTGTTSPYPTVLIVISVMYSESLQCGAGSAP